MKNLFYKFFSRNFSIKKMNANEIKIDALDSDKTAKAIGPYSKGTRIEVGDKYMLFISGQIGMDISGNLVSDEVKAQTQQALENLKNILE